MQTSQIRLGLIGYGEVGSTLGRGLRGSGLHSVVAYDKHAAEGPFAGLIRRRAQEAGVPLMRDARQLAAEADIILGVTPGSSSLESADTIAPHLTPIHLFVDVASATPKIKRAVAERCAAAGATLGDASIVGTPRTGMPCRSLPAARPPSGCATPWYPGACESRQSGRISAPHPASRSCGRS